MSALYCAHICIKYSLGISNFLEEICRLSHFVVFLYLFALITEKGFLSLLAVLWNSAFKCIQTLHSNLQIIQYDSLVVQMVKNLPVVQETWLRSLGQKDPLKKELATHSSILTWRIPWTEEPGGLQSMESQRVRHD